MADRSSPTLRPVQAPRLRTYRKGNARRPGPVTAVDVEGQTLLLVQTTLRGSQSIVTRIEIGHLDMEPEAARPDPAVLGRALAGALDDLRLKPAQVVMGVPRNLVILRTLLVPVIDDVRELASVVHLQIGKDLPFRQEEAVIDFKVHRSIVPPAEAPKPADPRSAMTGAPPVVADLSPKLEVLVAVVRRETVDFYQKVAEAAKLKLTGLGWLSQANARALEACQVAVESGAVALVSLRAEEVGIDIVADKSLLFSRGASVQAQKETVDEESAATETTAAPPASEPSGPGESKSFPDRVTIEVVRSLHSYAGTGAHQPVVKLVVAGATGEEATVLEVLRQRLSIPCSLLDLAQNLELPEPARHNAAGAIGALGLALGVNDPEGLPFDFLAPKRPAVHRDTRRIRMLGIIAAVAVLLIALLAVRSRMIHQRMKVQDALKAEVDKGKALLPTYKRVQRQAVAVQAWEKDSRNWLEQYAHLSAVLPGSEDLYITSLSISGQGNIHLAVQARSGEILANLDRQLRQAGYDVKPLAINPGNDKHGYNFRSTVELIVPPKLKIDLSKAQPPPRPADDASLDAKSRAGQKGGRS